MRSSGAWVSAGLLVGVGFLSPAQASPSPATPGVRTVFRFADPEITESSGLVDHGRLVLTVNDSGSGPVVYAVDARSGATVGRTTYTGDAVVDVEALAPGRGDEVWVGDIGDNRHQRLLISLYRVPRVGRADATVSAARYDLVYRGGAKDAEALLVHPRTGRVYLVSKGLFGGTVYAAPATLRDDRPNRLKPVGHVGGLVTDGVFLAGGRYALLRDYSDATLYDTRTWEPVASFDLPSQQQGEGLAVRPGGQRILVSSEGERSPVLSVALPRAVRDLVDPPEPTPSPGAGSPVVPGTPQAPTSNETGAWDALDGAVPDWLRTGALAAVVLGVALAVRAGFRASRRRSRSTR